MVNSLHGQGVDRLGEGLVVEATSPDGVIEGLRYNDEKQLSSACSGTPNGSLKNIRCQCAV